MKRSLIYLFLALVFAGFIYLIERPDIFDRGDFSENFLVEDYNAKDINVVEISQLINGVRLKSTDGKMWMVSELITPLKQNLLEKEGRDVPAEEWFEADEEKVNRALGAFGGMEEGVPVSKNPERFSLYNVAETGLYIKLFSDDKVVLDLIIGKNGPDFDSNYIRKNNDNNVYLIDQTLQGVFSIDINDWKKADSGLKDNE